MHSLRVQADALFLSAASTPPSPQLQGPYKLFYDVPLSSSVGGAGRGPPWGMKDLPLLRRRMPHVPLASLLRLLADGGEA